MLVSHVHIQIRFSVKGLATEATGPKVDLERKWKVSKNLISFSTFEKNIYPIVKLGQFLSAEHIAGKM